MKIQRTKKRIAAIGAHPFFIGKEDLWLKLRAGEAIEVPVDQYSSIKEVYGESIEPVPTKEVKLEKPVDKGEGE